jgi:hypothetical protein
VSTSTLDTLAAGLARALRPLAYATQSDDGITALLDELGWQPPSVPPALRSMARGLANLYESLGELTAAHQSADEGDEGGHALGRVAADLAIVIADLHALPARLRAELPAAYVAATHIDRDFEERLFDWLLSTHLARATPLAYRLLRLAGILDTSNFTPPAGLVLPALNEVHHIRWDRLLRMIDPAALAREVYGWGTASLNGERLFAELLPLTFALGMPAELRYARPDGDANADPIPQLWIPVFRSETTQLFLVAGVTPPRGDELAGLTLTIVPSAAGDLSIALGDQLELLLEATAQLGTSAALMLRPGRTPQVLLDSGGAAPAPLRNARLRAAVRWTAPGWQEDSGVTAGDGTRFSVRRVTLALGAEAASGDANVYAELIVEDGRLAVTPPAGDAVLASLLPEEGVRAAFSFALQWSREGLRFSGSGGLRTVVPLGAALGGLRLHGLELGVAAQDGRVVSDAAVSGSLRLGPAQLSVDGIGLQTNVRAAPGNLGPLDVAIGFKPPAGIGLSLEAGIVKGGGFLFADPANRQYAGVVELQLGKVGVKAIGLLGASPTGWSLLLLVFSQIPPVQLAFGFTLNGIGGMIGVRHALDIDQLIAGMKTGAFNDILFPADPVGDAPRIIQRLRTLFPLSPRSLAVGPMFDIGYGTPRIVFIRIGILIQLDNLLDSAAPLAMARVLLVGQLRVAIGPTRDDPDTTIVQLIVDILGFWDRERQRYGFLARLRDSKIAKIDVVGGLGVFGEYGDNPRFLLAAGGFNPRFKDVPTEMSGVIDRLGAAFKVGRFNLTFTGYFAVTPGTIQAGINFLATAKIGPVGLEGGLGLDVLIYLEPYTHFIADFRITAEVSYKGRTLAGVKVKGSIEGPGLWHIKGKVTFSILWWDISKSFDESWGTLPETTNVLTDVRALLAAELARRENWTAQLPAGRESMVTIGPPQGELAPLAHPLGRFVFSQRIAPLGLALERFGSGRVAGPNRFEITALTVSGQPASRVSVREHFARSQFVETSEEEKLTKPSFEEMDAGVEFSSTAFRTSANVLVSDMEYETAYLDVDPRRFNRTRRDSTLKRVGLDHELVRTLAAQGAAARAPQRREEQLRALAAAQIGIATPSLAAADRESFAHDTGVRLSGQARDVTMIAEQRFRPADAERAQLVEEFELAGV